ncbi:4Fe-4S dicluster domain-containing protein [Chloroflexota bacterium]
MNNQKDKASTITRREFIKVTGSIILVAGVGVYKPLKADALSTLTDTPGTGHRFLTTDGIPPADGYLLVDIAKCQGCVSCMLACSLIHEGVESLSLARIQIMQNSFAGFPDDVTIAQCRQCVEPLCVEVCPTEALAADAQHGNVRIVDKEACIGCGRCYEACPYTPSRAFLAVDEAYDGELTSRKCDLCANAPYHWDEAGGGPDGKQACVAICPVGAIMFTREIPEQDGNGGYIVNLRDENWAILGYPTS